MQIEINRYKKDLGGNTSSHAFFERKLKEVLINNIDQTNRIDELSVYNLNNEKHDYEAGTDRRYVIFIGGTMEQVGDEYISDFSSKINGLENKYDKILKPYGENGLILSEEGTPIAQWNKDTKELNILINLFDEKYLETSAHKENAVKIFKDIIVKFNEMVIKKLAYEDSWKYAENKDRLISRTKQRFENSARVSLRETERIINDLNSRIERNRTNLLNNYKNLSLNMARLEAEKKSLQDISDRVTKEFNMIAEYDKIEDVQIKENKIILFTKPLNIYASNGGTYYGGKYRVEIEHERSLVRFFGDNPRRGYWTNHDPHPHVNGGNGEACLGNVDATIVELCSQLQFFALATVLVDFLESANTSDPAGRKVTNWDRIEEDGTIIPSAKKCPRCNSELEDEECLVEAYRIDECGDLYDRHEVCENCIDEYYTWDEDYDKWILEEE